MKIDKLQQSKVILQYIFTEIFIYYSDYRIFLINASQNKK